MIFRDGSELYLPMSLLRLDNLHLAPAPPHPLRVRMEIGSFHLIWYHGFIVGPTVGQSVWLHRDMEAARCMLHSRLP